MIQDDHDSPWNHGDCPSDQQNLQIKSARKLGSLLFWTTVGGCFYRNAQFMCGGNKNRRCSIYFGLINLPKINHNVLFYMIREKNSYKKLGLTMINLFSKRETECNRHCFKKHVYHSQDPFFVGFWPGEIWKD